tara:strand:+ start:67 stop:336 length:270 start_codon:yes stop_codon:yes gene_type:complete
VPVKYLVLLNHLYPVNFVLYYLGVDMKQVEKFYKAVFHHAIDPDHKIVIDFLAPFPRQPNIDYEKLAIRAFNDEIRKRIIKITIPNLEE